METYLSFFYSRRALFLTVYRGAKVVRGYFVQQSKGEEERGKLLPCVFTLWTYVKVNVKYIVLVRNYEILWKEKEKN